MESKLFIFRDYVNLTSTTSYYDTYFKSSYEYV